MAIVEAVTGVFTAIGSWFIEFMPTVLAIFYTSEAGLTFLGVLTLCSLAIAVFMLVMRIIVQFIQFRS